MPEPTKTTWWTKVAPFIAGAGLWLMLSNLYNCAFPDHPAPALIEADGKTYVACSTPDTGRGWFHSTYYADFKDNNGQTISLRGIEKLAVTNLPHKIDAPMPSNPVAIDGKTYQEGAEYTWSDNTKARVENGRWVPVKITNIVCESDDDKEKREGSVSILKQSVTLSGWAVVSVVLAFSTSGVLFVPLGLYLAYWVRTRRGRSSAFWCYVIVIAISALALLVQRTLVLYRYPVGTSFFVLIGAAWLISLVAAPLLLRAELISLYRRSQGIDLKINPFLTILFSSVYLNYHVLDIPVAPFASQT
jgi:hypothetical protein